MGISKIKPLTSQYHSVGGSRGRGLLCLAPQLVLYVDDILVICFGDTRRTNRLSVNELQKIVNICENEPNLLDMQINVKKSCCMRVGQRHDAECADILSSDGTPIAWVDNIRYLDIIIVQSCKFRCSSYIW